MTRFNISCWLHQPTKAGTPPPHKRKAKTHRTLPDGMLNLELRVGEGRKYTITENTSFYHGTNRKDAVLPTVTARITGFLTPSRIRFPQLCLMKMIPNLSSTFSKSFQMNLPLFSEQCKPHLEFISHIPC